MVRTRVLGEQDDAPGIRHCATRSAVRRGSRRCCPACNTARPSTYAKWQGAHWVLITLAELGYPAGDGSLQPEAAEVLDTWLSPSTYREFTAQTKAAAYGRDGIPVIDGRPRSHTSQQGNALFSLNSASSSSTMLGRKPSPSGSPTGSGPTAAGTATSGQRQQCRRSSTATPIRGLAAHAALRSDDRARQLAEQAAEVLLERRLVFRRSSAELIHPEARAAALSALLALRRPCRPQGHRRRRTDRRPTVCRCTRPPGGQAATERRVAGRTALLAARLRRAFALYNQYVGVGAARQVPPRIRGSPPTPCTCSDPPDDSDHRCQTR